MSSSINQITTHELWAESRKISLVSTRTSDTSMRLSVSYPSNVKVIDGMVILVATESFGPDQNPNDGEQYVSSTVLGDPLASNLNGAQVVAFYSNALMLPAPGVVSGDSIIFSVDITGLIPEKMYYASVHGLSNVLQVYPFGIQSYPVDASRLEKASGIYVGNIPSLPSAPTTPSAGFVYYDKGLELVQYWHAPKQIWIPTRMDTILSGDVNPGVSGQCYLLDGTKIKAFDGKKFVEVTIDNTQVKNSAGAFVPFVKITSGTTYPLEPVVGEFFYSYTTSRIEYFDGVEWVFPSVGSTLLAIPGGMIPLFTTSFKPEPEDLVDPYHGLLFYNTKQKQLNVWDGQRWIHTNTDQEGSPTTDKVAIGTDGSYDDRLRLMKVLKLQLGWPVQCVELTEEHFNVAIDNALDTYRQLCSHAYERRFLLYTLFKNQQVYFLNSPMDGTDKIVNISKIFRLDTMGFTTGTNTFDANVFMQSFANLYNSSSHVDLLSIHLMANLQEEMNKIFAAEYIYTWSEARREMHITRRVARHEKVVIEVFMEKTEQEIMLDRFAKQFIQGWAIAECKEMLGLIRSKYTSGTPGPSGNITLNGDTLLTEARTDFTEWKQALLDWEHSSAESGNISFLMG
jgi:hypothetical protein